MDGIPSFVHCSVLRNGNHTLHQESWGDPSKFWGPDSPAPPASGCARGSRRKRRSSALLCVWFTPLDSCRFCRGVWNLPAVELNVAKRFFCCQDTNNHRPEFTNTTYAVTIPETTPPGCISDAPAIVMHGVAYSVCIVLQVPVSALKVWVGRHEGHLVCKILPLLSPEGSGAGAIRHGGGHVPSHFWN